MRFNRPAPTRLVPFSYFCTCWNVRSSCVARSVCDISWQDDGRECDGPPPYPADHNFSCSSYPFHLPLDCWSEGALRCYDTFGFLALTRGAMSQPPRGGPSRWTAHSSTEI